MEFPDWVQVKVRNTIVLPETVEQLCLIASLTAHVHRKVHFLSWLMARATKYRTIILITNSFRICIIFHLFES